MLDTKPRDFSYVNHKDKYPLELSGTMKKRQRFPIAKENACDKMNALTFGAGETDKKKLLDRITENYQDLKSVIPMDYDVNLKKSAIRTYPKQSHVGLSGASYLMVKSGIKADHPQRRHIDSRVNLTEAKPESKKKHFCQLTKQSEKEWQAIRPHTETLQHRLHNDLYSNFNRRDRPHSSTVRMNQKNMFTEGQNLGLEPHKTKKISCAKHQQLMGTYNAPNNRQNRNTRDDWRRSSFVLG